MKRKAIIIGAIIAIVIIVIAIVVILARRKKQSGIDTITVDQSQTTISDTQATLIADNVLAAMNRYGTDETAIITNLTGLNKNDLLLVIKKFGIRNYTGQVEASNWFAKNLFSTPMNLTGWLRSELSGNSLTTVKNIFVTNNVPF